MANKSLRAAINANCKACIFDKGAPGTWLGQVTLCSVKTCELYDVRPTTDTIPESVIKYYGVTKGEISRLSLKSPPEGRFSEKTKESYIPGKAA